MAGCVHAWNSRWTDSIRQKSLFSKNIKINNNMVMQHETMKQTTTRECAQKRENWSHLEGRVCPPEFQNVPHIDSCVCLFMPRLKIPRFCINTAATVNNFFLNNRAAVTHLNAVMLLWYGISLSKISLSCPVYFWPGASRSCPFNSPGFYLICLKLVTMSHEHWYMSLLDP